MNVTEALGLENVMFFDAPRLTLSKKQSQAKSYEVRGQSNVCHTFVIFTPAFKWEVSLVIS